MPGTGGMFMLLLMLLVGALAGNIIILLMQALLPLPADFTATYGMLVSYPVMFIPAMMYASGQSRRNELFDGQVPLDSRYSANISQNAALAVTVSAATLACAFVVEPITMLLPDMPESLKAVFDNMMNGMPLWATLLSVSVFAPFFEEWLCRGMVLRGLLGKMKPVWAITVSALFFAVIHFNPWQAIPAFVLGMLFGYVYYKTGSLKLTMLMHCVNNTFSVCMSQVDKFKEADFFMEVMAPGIYAAMFVICLIFLATFLYRMSRLPSRSFESRPDIPE